MALVPWRGEDIDRLRGEIDRMFERFWGEAPVSMRAALWQPYIDLTETEDAFLVRGELPGIDPKEIDIDLAGRTLTLKGEKRRERKEEDETHRLIERSYGCFRRTVELPAEVKPEEVSATYKNGVLTVTLPKSERARTKRIPVKTAERLEA